MINHIHYKVMDENYHLLPNLYGVIIQVKGVPEVFAYTMNYTVSDAWNQDCTQHVVMLESTPSFRWSFQRQRLMEGYGAPVTYWMGDDLTVTRIWK